MTHTKCPRCRKATKNLHPEDGLCPKCEREWTAETTQNADIFFGTLEAHAALAMNDALGG